MGSFDTATFALLGNALFDRVDVSVRKTLRLFFKNELIDDFGTTVLIRQRIIVLQSTKIAVENFFVPSVLVYFFGYKGKSICAD